MTDRSLPRRLFLKRGGVAMAAFGMGSLLTPSFVRRAAMAADATGGAGRKVLICLFQRGAADGLSMVAPFGDPFYLRHRQEIALDAPARAAGENAALDLDGYFGLHPAMASLLPIYKAGHLAVIHAAGSPSSSRSHFDMQDFMEAAAVDDKSVSTGWLNRMVAQRQEDRSKVTPFRAVSMTPVVPRSLQGEVDALAIRDLATFGVKPGSGASSGAAAGFEGMYENAVGDVLHGTGKESFEAISMLKKADPTRYAPAHGATYPQGNFGHAMKQVAQLIKADLGMEVAFVEMDGWDTHANQGNAFGQLAGRLRDFSQGIAALHTDMGDKMSEVLLLTMSEFGRAVRQNGNRGTDHGHGTCFFAMGGGVKGGRVLGDWPTLAPEKLFEERDLAVTTDFRDIFAEACTRHFGIDAAGLAKIFPRYAIKPERFRGYLA